MTFSDDSNTHDAHILDYVYEIGRTTRQLNKAEATERDLMRRIIEEWNHIKHLREEQGYINTTVKLTIKREEVMLVERIEEDSSFPNGEKIHKNYSI